MYIKKTCDPEISSVKYDILIVVTMKIAIVWYVTQCDLIEFYQHFRGICCLHQYKSGRNIKGPQYVMSVNLKLYIRNVK